MGPEDGTSAVVSVIVPAKNEAEYIDACLDSILAQNTELSYEIIVVDGDSSDETVEVAQSYPTTVIEGPGESIGHGRQLGAYQAVGDFYVFIDADTIIDQNYLDELYEYVTSNDLIAGSARCRMPSYRAKLMQGTINRLFPRLPKTILPGFNFFVRADAYHKAGGFPSVPNEDTQFSRQLAKQGPTGYHPDVLVETSARRISQSGLTGTLFHYLKLDIARVRADV